MEPLKIAAVQFETRDNDRAHNPSVIREMCRKASVERADVVAFHEYLVCGYTFVKDLSRKELLTIAESIPAGESAQALTVIAREFGVTLLAGFFERDGDRIYRAQVCVDGNGLKTKYRKLHPFISPNILPGDQYVVSEIKGWKRGILTYYDNNIIENIRATASSGADIIFMPYVAMCIPSPRPEVDLINPMLWENRVNDPTSLRQEFDGLKGRAWLMKWFPARAYDNAVYVVFFNSIGHDYNEIKNGCSMIPGPFGDVVVECRRLGDDFVIVTAIPEKLKQAGGYRYRNTRRPELYVNTIGQPHGSSQKVAWLTEITNK